jgi:SPP1 gp7 family putative phage head morphogenesis protein
MAQVRAGLIAGENPRTTARKIKVGLPLTASQQGHVASFADDIDRIVAEGMRSGKSWGLYTAKDIADLQASNPKLAQQLGFTAREMKEGRRWGKISRSAGTLVGDSKPIGFVADPRTQAGENAFRIDADGNPIDRMWKWRLRDKTLDPYLFDVIAAEQAGDPVALAKAKAALQGKAALMKTRYNERYIKHRSMVIARTEALRAANLGSYEGWRQAIQDTGALDEAQIKRRWVTAKDDRVRPDHRGAAGQVRGFNEPFMVGGQGVMFPPHQPNCRCTVAYVVDLTPTT